MIKFYMHNGSENHGCEAIVRSSKKILDEEVILYSRNPEQDLKYSIEEVCKVEFDEESSLKRGSFAWFISSIQTKIFNKIDLAIKYRYRNFLRNVSSNDICFSIGGDNYCYPGTEVLAAINRNIRKKGAKLVLWGCSVDPELLMIKEMEKDIAGFDLITTRESISYDALKKVNPHTILVSDPAFTLDTITLPLPDGWKEGHMVGINASPLILQSGKSGELVFEAYRQLIFYIIHNTEFNIALVPHVVCKENNDLEVLHKLYNSIDNKERLVLLNDCNCMEVKGYISRCRLFIGARTHSTIAAYSHCVPTLVLGYSVKSRGIAKDLFGTEENYVLPVQKLVNTDELVNGFKWLLSNESTIKQHLLDVMPEYIKKAYRAKESFESLLK